MPAEGAGRLECVCEALVARKAQDIVVLEISALSSIADQFVIASARSRLAVQALADGVREAMEGLGERPRHAEGRAEARWVCLDFGDVIVQLFQEDVRRYFDLERLWGDAPLRRIADAVTAATG